MTRKKLTDEDLKHHDPHKATRLLAARRRRANEKANPTAKAKILALVPAPTSAPYIATPPDAPKTRHRVDPAPAPDDLKATLEAREVEIYEDVKRALLGVKRWSETACSGQAWTYAKCTAAVEIIGVLALPSHVLTNQRGAAQALGLKELPADKLASARSRIAGGDW